MHIVSLLADKLRLVDGVNDQEGRLEVRHNGVWGTICKHSFDTIDASAACLTLGLGLVRFKFLVSIELTLVWVSS